MARDEEEDKTIYKAVLNHEEQYSIWAADRDMPLGWKETGKQGLNPEVLDWIGQVWTDMRPLSLQKKMAEDEERRKHEPPPPPPPPSKPDDLLDRLSKDQEVIAGANTTTVEDLKGQVDRGYVHVKFTQTKGGTDLGVRAIKELSDFSKADWAAKKGSIKVVGDLTLNYVRIRVHATLQLETLKGTGRIEKLQQPTGAGKG